MSAPWLLDFHASQTTHQRLQLLSADAKPKYTSNKQCYHCRVREAKPQFLSVGHCRAFLDRTRLPMRARYTELPRQGQTAMLPPAHRAHQTLLRVSLTEHGCVAGVQGGFAMYVPPTQAQSYGAGPGYPGPSYAPAPPMDDRYGGKANKDSVLAITRCVREEEVCAAAVPAGRNSNRVMESVIPPRSRRWFKSRSQREKTYMGVIAGLAVRLRVSEASVGGERFGADPLARSGRSYFGHVRGAAVCAPCTETRGVHCHALS